MYCGHLYLRGPEKGNLMILPVPVRGGGGSEGNFKENTGNNP